MRIASLLAAILCMLPVRSVRAAATLSHDLGTYRLLAIRAIRARALQVQQGNVGVEDASGFISVSGRLDAPVSQVVAHDVKLQSGAQCAALFADGLVGQSCAPSETHPFAGNGPIIANSAGGAFTAVTRECGYPSADKFRFSSSQITVHSGQIVPLDPGQYGDLTLNGGELVLRPSTEGEYTFRTIHASRDAKIRVDPAGAAGALARVNVAKDVFLGNNSRVGPVRLFVDGTQVLLARATRVQGTLCAPRAVLLLRGANSLEGTFVADTIKTGQGLFLAPPTICECNGSSAGGAFVCGGSSAGGSFVGGFLERDDAALQCCRCDGCHLFNVPCPTTTTSTVTSTTVSSSVTTTSTTTGTCAPNHCGNGRLEPECGEQCDRSAFGSFVCSSAGGSLLCTGDCTVDFSNCVPHEVCGDCADNDGNGLTDFEDPACCAGAQRFQLTLRRGVIRPNGAVSRLRLKSILARAGLTTVDPTKQDVFLQIRQEGSGELLCAHVPAGKFARHGRVFKFKDPRHTVTSAGGLDRLIVRLARHGIARLKAAGKQARFEKSPKAGSVEITVGFRDPTASESANRCSAATATFRTPRGKGTRAGVRFP